MSWFSSFFDWLLCLLKSLVNWVMDMLADVWYYTIGWLIRALPDSPFMFEPLQWGVFGNFIGYFIPIAKMAAHFTVILIAIAIYYVIRNVLRLAKMIK